MKIKKIKSQGEFIYPATIAAAIKDANFQKDGSAMTQGEINKDLSDNKVDKEEDKSLVSNTEIEKLSNLPNKSDLDSAISDAKQAGIDAQTNLNTHTSDTNNPHSVTKAQLGLGNVDNTSDANKPISTATQTALDNKANKSDIPTKVSELENDKGYLVSTDIDDKIANKADKTDIPTKTSQLTNDSGFLTEHQSLEGYAKTTDIPTKVSQLTNDKNYLTEHQDISGKQDKLTETQLSNLNEDHSKYLTEHQSLAEYEKTNVVNTKLALKADKSDIPTKVSELTNDNEYTTKTYVDTQNDSKFDDVSYNKETKKINFLVGKTVKTSIDATDFIKDGMVDEVKIDNGKLIITFNTDSGKDAINLKLTDIFNPDNYYNKTDADNTFAPSTHTHKKADITDFPTIPTKTSQLTNDSGFLTSHQDISGKQDKLVSGTNIKTINGNSILGSGNIKIDVTVDTAMSSASTNPVQNKVITSALNDKVDNSTLSSYATKTDVTTALSGYAKTDQVGVTSVSQGSSNGTISVTTNGSTSNVSVKGLNNFAYTNYEVVDSLPGSPTEDKFYFIKE